eukprot:UN26670
MAAIKKNHKDIAYYLLKETDVKLDYLDKQGNHLLHLACSSEMGDVVGILLEQKVDPNITNNEGKTALNLACKKGNISIVEKLLEYKAVMHADNKYDNLGIAVSNNRASLASFLIKNHECNITNEIWLDACRKGYLEIMKILEDLSQKSTSFINLKEVQDGPGYLVQHNYGEALAWMLEKGEDPNKIQNRATGSTLLMTA